MTSRYFKDLFGRSIRLSEERKKHIKDSHPELTGQLFRVTETLLQPDTIIRSKSDTESELFYKLFENTPVGAKYLCVVVKTKLDDYFILTVYFTETIKKGDILWTNKNK